MTVQNSRKILITVGLLLCGIDIAAFVYTGNGHGGFWQYAVLIADISVLAFLLFAMALELKRSLKVTLYSYKNIMLIGGILYVFVLAAVLLSYFVSCLFNHQLSVAEVYREMIAFPRRFSYYAVFVIFAVSVLIGISNLALMRHEGFRPRNAMSVLIAVLYIGGTLLLYAGADWFTDTVMAGYVAAGNRWALWLNTTVPLFFLLMLCYFECVLVGTAVMGWQAARQVPTYDRDYIIILGCSIDKKGGLLPLLKGRVNRAVRFAWEQEIASGKPLKYVPSGGQGANEIMSEGSAMELYLLTRGAERDEVFPEKESADTFENMLFSKKIIEEQCEHPKIAFATTNYHMLRSGILARKAGMDAEGIAGDTKWYFWPNGFIREFFGILALNLKTHITVAAVMAVLCAAVGLIGWFGNFL